MHVVLGMLLVISDWLMLRKAHIVYQDEFLVLIEVCCWKRSVCYYLP